MEKAGRRRASSGGAAYVEAAAHWLLGKGICAGWQRDGTDMQDSDGMGFGTGKRLLKGAWICESFFISSFCLRRPLCTDINVLS